MTAPLLDPILTKPCPHCTGQLVLYGVTPATRARPPGLATVRPDVLPLPGTVLRWACYGLDAINSVLDHDFVEHPVYPCSPVEYLQVAREGWAGAAFDIWAIQEGDFIKDRDLGHVTGIVIGTGTMAFGKQVLPAYQIRRADSSTSVIFVADAVLVCYTFDGLLGAMRVADDHPQPLAAQAATADPASIAAIWDRAGEGST